MGTPRGRLEGWGLLDRDSRWAVDVRWLESSKWAPQSSQNREEGGGLQRKKGVTGKEGKADDLKPPLCRTWQAGQPAPCF